MQPSADIIATTIAGQRCEALLAGGDALVEDNTKNNRFAKRAIVGPSQALTLPIISSI
jgi:hypothetical protein